MSLRSRSASPSGSSGSSYASSSDSESEDDSSQLLEAARKAAALKAGAANDAFARQEDQLTFSARPHTSSLQQEPQLQPVASTSKAVANTSQSASTDPPDQFGQLPRKHLSKKAYNAKQPKSAGNNWFHMPAAPKEPSEALKREVAALKLGAAIDPKRFLRGEAKRDAGKLPEYFQMGHVLASDHPASTERRGPGKAGKKRSFVDEIAEDQQVRDYTKRKFGEVQHKTSSGGKNYYKSRQSKKTGGKSGIKRK